MASAAARMDLDPDELEEVLNKERPITPALVLRLERGGWPEASAMMRIQAAYDLAQERRRQESTTDPLDQSEILAGMARGG